MKTMTRWLAPWLLACAVPIHAQLRGESMRLVAPDSATNDRFGCEVALEGDQALVGAYGHGAAYLFARDQGAPGAWGLVKELVPSPSSYLFGIRVALEHDLAACAANDGTVHVFARNSGGTGNWGEEKRLSFPWTPIGPALALEGDILVVGDPGANAVFVHERNLGGPGNWGQRARLVDLTPDSNSFGSAVSLSGTTLFVTRLPLVVGSYITGTVHVFERDRGGAGAWGAVQTLASPEGTPDMFGTAAVDGDFAVVGAYAGRSGAGAAYLYARGPSSTAPWSLVRTIVDPAGAAGLLGRTVALEGDVLVVGAFFDRTLVPLRSSALVFVRDLGGAGAWGLRARLAPQGAGGPGFLPRALSGGVVLGADENEGFSGAAYVFDVARAANRVRNGAGTNPSCYSSETLPKLGSLWRGVVDTSGHPQAVATALVGYELPSQGSTIRAGEILVDPSSRRLFAGFAPVVGSNSTHVIAIPLRPALIGLTCSTQAAIVGHATVLCNALDLVVGP